MHDSHTQRASHQAQVDTDKIQLIANNMPTMLIGNLVGSIPVTVILFKQGYSSVIFWMASLYILTLVRWLHHRELNITTASIQQIYKLGNGYLLFSLLSGSAWGSLGIFFFNAEDITAFTVIIVTLASFVGGSMTSMSARPVYYYAFLLPAAMPITVNMLLQDLPFYLWLGIAAIIYLVTTVAFSRNLHRVINNSLVLKYENIDLLDDLKTQTGSANKANSDKSQFLAAASHDLRQPLHAVNLFVETLKNKIQIKDQQHDIDRIQRGLNSMGELFEVLLDISELDSRTTSVNKIDFSIDEMLHNLVEQFSDDVNAKQLFLNFKPSDKVVCSDPVLLERLIRNLLSNAIHYTDKGGINVFFKHDNKEIVCLHIQDTGIGIPSDKTEYVFGEFIQLDNPERDRSKGLGLGLAIVRRVALLLELTLCLKSELNKGSLFTIELPLGDQNIGLTSIPPSLLTENKLQGLNVLVIDNEHDILEAIKDLLETWQCHFTGSASAEEAERLIAEGYQPDFILSDYRLPGKRNGCQLVSDIHQNIGYIPTLIITGDTVNDVDTQAKALGLIALRKPVKPAQLRIAMTRLIKRSGQ